MEEASKEMILSHSKGTNLGAGRVRTGMEFRAHPPVEKSLKIQRGKAIYPRSHSKWDRRDIQPSAWRQPVPPPNLPWLEIPLPHLVIQAAQCSQPGEAGPGFLRPTGKSLITSGCPQVPSFTGPNFWGQMLPGEALEPAAGTTGHSTPGGGSGGGSRGLGTSQGC